MYGSAFRPSDVIASSTLETPIFIFLVKHHCRRDLIYLRPAMSDDHKCQRINRLGQVRVGARWVKDEVISPPTKDPKLLNTQGNFQFNYSIFDIF